MGVLLAFGVVAVGLAGTARADEKALIERLEKLEKQNEELRKKLEGMPVVPAQMPGTTPGTPAPWPGDPKAAEKAEKEKINKQIDTYLKEKDAQKKAEKAEKEASGIRIGSDLSIQARWRPDQGLYFETPNKEIQTHLGFFLQWDTVSWTQTPALKPASQVGDLQDGTYFRRIRPLWDGQAYDTFEWNVILALEQIGQVSQPTLSTVTSKAGNVTAATLTAGNGQGLINLDEVWAGVYGIPIIGRIRAGHMKVPQGLEGNQMTSSRSMTFMENAAYTDAFYNVFGTGVQIANTALDDRITWQGMWYRNDFTNRGNTGIDFGDGAYCYTGRMTALLIDEDEDRHLLHVGVSGTWRRAEKAGQELTGLGVIRYRARPELRDAFGGLGDGVLPGDSTRMVDTGALSAQSDAVFGTELAYIAGPLSFQGEWAYAQISDAATGAGRTARKGSLGFNGGYVQLSYFLTGETRNYDKSFGVFNRNYVTPFTNFWAKARDGGGVTFGPGALELAVRYSYLNLNDGPIDGGVLEGLTVGLNWYLSSNLKFQMEWVHNQRWDKQTGGGGTIAGRTDGFGTRVQFQF
jgi:phosphate-selective porin OprO/OprP